MRRPGVGFAIASILALACAGAFRVAAPEGRHRVAPVEGAGRLVGNAGCLECHDDFSGHHVHSSAHADCESCHGPGQLHEHTVSAEAIRFPSSEDCAACHAPASRTLAHWETSPHAQSDVLCSDCHAVHDRQPALLRAPSDLDTALLRHASADTKLCASCHATVLAELGLPSRHPVKEGMLDCLDCHAAHADDRALARPEGRTCGSCHQEVMGPWVFEHAPVSEDCGYCHVPHGAVADDLLEVSQPAACVSCHTLAESGAVHQPWAFTTDCTDCHGAVHGSYTDPHLRR